MIEFKNNHKKYDVTNSINTKGFNHIDYAENEG